MPADTNYEDALRILVRGLIRSIEGNNPVGMTEKDETRLVLQGLAIVAAVFIADAGQIPWLEGFRQMVAAALADLRVPVAEAERLH
jgi:hypothetical protein